MTGNLSEAVSLYQTLKKEFNKKNANIEKCHQFMKNLKIALCGLSFLPSGKTVPSVQEYVLARDVLEIGAHLSIKMKDIPAFERYMSQLKCYYLDNTNEVPNSPYKQQLLGLNLLCLLAQNRVAEFHTELERLSIADIQSNVYIKHPIAIEQYLMEGNYNKLFLAKGNVPAESYNFFIDILLGTIRGEIAACMEKSYSSIQVQEAMHMLYFDDQAAFSEYTKELGWNVASDKCFHFLSGKGDDDSTTVPASELAAQVINYARELEMII